jgi:hypothetical protein
VLIEPALSVPEGDGVTDIARSAFTLLPTTEAVLDAVVIRWPPQLPAGVGPGYERA